MPVNRHATAGIGRTGPGYCVTRSPVPRRPRSCVAFGVVLALSRKIASHDLFIYSAPLPSPAPPRLRARRRGRRPGIFRIPPRVTAAARIVCAVCLAGVSGSPPRAALRGAGARRHRSTRQGAGRGRGRGRGADAAGRRGAAECQRVGYPIQRPLRHRRSPATRLRPFRRFTGRQPAADPRTPAVVPPGTDAGPGVQPHARHDAGTVERPRADDADRTGHWGRPPPHAPRHRADRPDAQRDLFQPQPRRQDRERRLQSRTRIQERARDRHGTLRPVHERECQPRSRRRGVPRQSRPRSVLPRAECAERDRERPHLAVVRLRLAARKCVRR